MKITGATVAVYETHDAAEQAVKILSNAGVELRKISIVGRGYQSEEHATGFFNTGDRVKFYGRFGAFWGTLAGILLGSFVMFIPVLGHIVILGPLAATVIGGLEGAAVGGASGALVGAFTGIGIPRESAIRYERTIGADKYLLMIQGTPTDLKLAEQALRPTDPLSLATHSEPVPAAA